jgi:hypothetical protein
MFSQFLAQDFLSPGKKPTPKKRGFTNQPLYNPVIHSIIAAGVNYKPSAPRNFTEVAYYHWPLHKKVTSITIQMFGFRMRNCPISIPTSEFQTTMWVSSLVTNCRSTKPRWSRPEWYGHNKFGRNSPNG